MAANKHKIICSLGCHLDYQGLRCPGLNIFQCSVCCIRNEKEELAHIFAQKNIHINCLQLTLHKNIDPCISGYTILYAMISRLRLLVSILNAWQMSKYLTTCVQQNHHDWGFQWKSLAMGLYVLQSLWQMHQHICLIYKRKTQNQPTYIGHITLSAIPTWPTYQQIFFRDNPGKLQMI